MGDCGFSPKWATFFPIGESIMTNGGGPMSAPKSQTTDEKEDQRTQEEKSARTTDTAEAVDKSKE